MCHSATDGFSWIAGTQLVVVVMGVIILTCRVVVVSEGAAALVVADAGETSGEIQDRCTFDSLAAGAQDSLSVVVVVVAEADGDEADGEKALRKNWRRDLQMYVATIDYDSK
jgi:hypothetical protein